MPTERRSHVVAPSSQRRVGCGPLAFGYVIQSDGGGPPAKRADVGSLVWVSWRSSSSRRSWNSSSARGSALWPGVELRAPRAQGAEHLDERAVCPPVGDEL